MSGPVFVGRRELRLLLTRSQSDPSRRAHLPLSGNASDSLQRTLIALQMDTYVRPHRHVREDRPIVEHLALLQGAIGVILFDLDGLSGAMGRVGMDEGGRYCEIPDGIAHTVVALAPDTVVLECKPGPYEPDTHVQYLPGFPERHEDATALLALWVARLRGGWRRF